jgi:methylase of polypeptide subunit release factors
VERLQLDERIPAVARLKGVLDAHGFTGPDAMAALGSKLVPEHSRMDRPLYLRRLARPTPLHVLIRLFGLFDAASEDDARRAFAPLALEEVLATGVVSRAPDGIRASVGLSSFEGLLVAHDRYEGSEPHLARDHVLGVNPATTSLADLTVRLPVESALDVGCGGGVQALLAARHARQVVGVDVNPRALSLARFNARLNGVENVEWLEGDLFAPVAGRRFDLVVSNPPYVISPESTYTFRDAGRRGDALSAEVVRSAADHLQEGGFATILCNWALAEGEDPMAPPRRWVEGKGCDAWFVDRGRQDALGYAAVWNRGRDAASYSEALERWTAHYEREGIAAVGLGAVVLRRRSGAANWTRTDVPGATRGSAHEHVLRIFAAQDLLAGDGNGAFLAHRFRPAPDHRVVQLLVPANGGYAGSSLLRLEGGLAFEGGMDQHGFQLLRGCDGERPLHDVVEEVCRGGGVERASVVEVARQLVSLGFLVRSGPKAGERT